MKHLISVLFFSTLLSACTNVADYRPIGSPPPAEQAELITDEVN
ncbi:MULTISPECIES: hypothetical protein [Vibrio]|nr:MULTISPECIES: hypothetical protein [Vibrio]